MKRYSVVIVGCGNIGTQYDDYNSEKILSYAHAFNSDHNFELIGLVDPNTENRNTSVERWKVHGYQTIRDLFQQVQHVDIVVNAVPDLLHYSVLKELSLYDIDLIITEKPLASSLKEALDIQFLFENTKTKIGINYSRRFISEYIDIKQKIKTGEFGDFLCGTAFYGKGFMHNGSHMLDLIYYLLEEHFTYSEYKRISDFKDSDPTKSALLHFSNNRYIDLIGTDSKKFTIFELDLIFERGRIKLLDSGFCVEIYKLKENAHYLGYYNFILDTKFAIDFSAPLIGLTKNIFNYFNGGELACTLEDGIRVIEEWML